MKKLWLTLHCLSIVILPLVAQLEAFEVCQNITIRNIALFVKPYKIWFILTSVIIIFLYTIWPRWLRPQKEKNKLIKEMLTRINTELFGGNENDHRITLFKEISWFRALIRNYGYMIFHLFRYRKKFLLYLKPPKFGRYLIVNSRCGRRFKKSSTMFRVEMNKEEQCEGVVGRIRYLGLSVHINDLEDISNIDIMNYRQKKDMGTSHKKKVKKYMKDGFIPDFNLLKKIHRRARHFYGTVIEKNEKTWGILLVDSSASNDPFHKNVQERFNSFAITIGNIVQMEI